MGTPVLATSPKGAVGPALSWPWDGAVHPASSTRASETSAASARVMQCHRAESVTAPCPEAASVDSVHTPFAAISLMGLTHTPTAAGSSGRPATRKCSCSLLSLDLLWFFIQLLMTVDAEDASARDGEKWFALSGPRRVAQSSPRQMRMRRLEPRRVSGSNPRSYMF